MLLVSELNAKPRVILGTMTFGPDADKGARVTNFSDYTACLDAFQSAGYTEIDTARVYVGGKQEGWTRDAKWNERGLTLATKCYPTEPGMHSPDRVRATLETSLRELGLRDDKGDGKGAVDIFYLHAADRSVPFEVTLREVDKMHKEGKFVRLGLSNFVAFEVAEVVMLCKQNNWVKPSIYQGMYNAITRSLEYELIPACRRYGLDIVVYNPLAGGLFSPKMMSKDMVPESGRFSDTSKTGEAYRKRYFRDSVFNALKIVDEAAESSGLSKVEIALRWVTHHSALRVAGVEYKDKNGDKVSGNDGVIIGVSSQSQLEGNLKDLEKGPLPEEVVQALDKAWEAAKGDQPNYWHLDLDYTYDTKEALFGNNA